MSSPQSPTANRREVMTAAGALLLSSGTGAAAQARAADRLHLGACYYPEHWPESWWAKDAADMARRGISRVRIAEFAWSRFEPEPGRFDWAWLDRAIETLAAAGLEVVLGTPTATPPKWLVDKHPDMLPVAADGAVKGFGSRRYYTFSSDAYFEESRRIVEVMAGRYGRHKAVVGWQTDNEYGCHDTALSYGPVDLVAFRRWLQARYKTPQALNTAWGNVVWSQEVRSFDEVVMPSPKRTPYDFSPAARLDYWRFSSDQIARYNKMQVDILRRLSPGRFITHNFMGNFTDFDHYPVAADLDFASWDSYPTGVAAYLPEAEAKRYFATGHPDITSFNHDLMRGLAAKPFWVMEAQPGPINWAPWNAVPAPGMVRLWTWEAFAHGADTVSYWRWRQSPFGPEQMCSGLNDPDRAISPGGREAARVGEEIGRIGPVPATARAPVAMLFDYQSNWIMKIQPHGADFDHLKLVQDWYSALRRAGLDVDIVPPGAPLEGYRLTVVPTLAIVDDKAVAAFEAAKGLAVFGPRTGFRDVNSAIPGDMPPGPLKKLLPLKVRQVSSMRPGVEERISGAGLGGKMIRWREWIETKLPALARYGDGEAAVVGSDRRWYVGGWGDREMLDSLVAAAAAKAGLATIKLPEDVRIRRRGDLAFAFNYGSAPAALPVPAGATFLLGAATVQPHDVACWRERG